MNDIHFEYIPSTTTVAPCLPLDSRTQFIAVPGPIDPPQVTLLAQLSAEHMAALRAMVREEARAAIRDGLRTLAYVNGWVFAEPQ